MLRVLLVDDHPLMLEALDRAVRRLPRECHVTSATDYASAVRAAEAEGPFDLVLLDPGLPDTEGLSALADFRNRFPTMPVVCISATAAKQVVLKAIDLGAMGYIPKTAEGDAVIAALDHVLAGGIFVPAELMRTEAHSRDTPPEPVVPASARPPVDPASLGLTGRQFDVLALLVKGLPNKLIARQLQLSNGTVKSHLSAIFRALNVNTRTQAVVASGMLGVRLPPTGPAK